MPRRGASEATRRARRSKRKGREFEKRVAQEIREWTGLSEDHVAHSRASFSGADILLSQEARRLFPFWIECKNQKTLNIPAWLRQAAEGSQKEGGVLTPVLVFKQHQDGTMYAVLPFFSFMELATRYRINEVADGPHEG